MNNLRMKESLEKKACLDVNIVGTPLEGFEGQIWELKRFEDGMDYCDAAGEQWIWSVGRRRTDRRVFASIDTRFYQNEMFECLWLR